VRYTSASAFRQALESRLQTLSRDEGIAIVRLRKQVAFDRLLARLLLAAPGRWVLKGGLALEYRFGTCARSTRDMDLAGSADEETATADLLAAQDLDLGDYFGFTIERTAKLDDLVEGTAVRYHVRADLGGRRFEDVVVDVGFDLPPGWETEMLKGTDVLAFAGIDAVQAPSIALELQVAEKVDAYTRAYGPRGIRSTRVKDIVDLALIASTVSLDAERLHRALGDTFGQRGDRDLPVVLAPPPSNWDVPFRRLAAEIGMKVDLKGGHELASRLLDPILSDEIETGTWNVAAAGWGTDHAERGPR
jgi:hypothetical protein